IALLLFNSLQGIVLQPIRELSLTLRNITQKKDYSIRAANHHEYELGDLIELFNSLLNTIETDNTSLKESEDRFRKLTTLAPVGIFQLDQKLKLTYTNQHWRNIHHTNNPTPTLSEWFRCIHPEDLHKLQPSWQALITQQNSFAEEFRI